MNFLLPIRGVQLLFAIICLGLSGYLVSVGYGDDYYGRDYSVGEFGFALFTSLWTILVLIYLIPATLGKFLPAALLHPLAVLGVDIITLIFWFAAFIAVAAWRGKYEICSGYGFCGTSAAFAAFGAFQWALFVASTVLLGLGWNKNRTGGSKAPPAAGAGVTV